MSEYHKIETLYERDPKTFKVYPGQLKNRVYGIIKEWEWTEKIDGTNIRAQWDGAALTFGGKTDNAQIPAKLLNWLRDNVTVEKMRETFGESPAVVYGEGYGAGIQKAGGLYSQAQELIVFDVLVDGKWWLNMENVADVCAKLSLDMVPFHSTRSLEEATEIVRAGFPSFINGGAQQAEGLVGRTCEALFDKKGHRLIVKLKTKDF